MAVTKQVYNLSPTWTASGLADLFRSAFIDAGLMTDWYDSFLSGSVENRILEVVNDGTKTYGTVYYWFMFTTTTFSVHTALSWDAVSHIPTGTLYEDYTSTTTNSNSSQFLLYENLANQTSLTLTRYVSAINTSCTWFVFRQNGTLRFLIPYGAYTATSFVDQNVTAFNGLMYLNGNSSNFNSQLLFVHGACHTRRTYLGATALNGYTSVTYFRTTFTLASYGAFGNVSGNANSNQSTAQDPTWLPTAFTNTNSALSADYTPVFTSIQCSPYLPPLPADFAIAPYYASTAIGTGDTFVVSAGTEEYEVLRAQTSGSTTSGSAVTLFLARTV